MTELIIGLGAKVMSAALPLLISKIKKIADKKRKANSQFKDRWIVLNYSGHPLAGEAIASINKMLDAPAILDVSIPNVDGHDLVERAVELVEKTAKLGAAEQMLVGKYLVIPCGLSSLWSVMVVIFHAISGHFPNMIPLWRKDGVFQPEEMVDLQSIRNQMREARF